MKIVLGHGFLKAFGNCFPILLGTAHTPSEHLFIYFVLILGEFFIFFFNKRDNFMWVN